MLLINKYIYTCENVGQSSLQFVKTVHLYKREWHLCLQVNMRIHVIMHADNKVQQVQQPVRVRAYVFFSKIHKTVLLIFKKSYFKNVDQW